MYSNNITEYREMNKNIKIFLYIYKIFNSTLYCIYYLLIGLNLI